MIKRISRIQNVGCFKNSNAAGLPLSRVTVIYGRNGYGKSTLVDIFRSLANDDPTILEKRRTVSRSKVGKTAQQQLVEIAEQSGSEKQQMITFRGGWVPDQLPFEIEIFDSVFVHRNVFSGLDLSRENKEHLSTLPLGAESVRLAEEIEQLEKEKNAAKKNGTQIQKDLQKDIPGFDGKFLRSPLEDLNSLDFEIGVKRTEIEKLRKSLEKKQSITSAKLPTKLPSLDGFEEALSMFGDLLGSSYDGFSASVFSSFRSHFAACFSHTDGKEESWIQAGLAYAKAGSSARCPFCGREMRGIEIVEHYRNFFDEAYKSHESKIKTGLSQTRDNFDRFLSTLSNLEKDSLAGTLVLLRFQEYLAEDYQVHADDLEKKQVELATETQAILSLLERVKASLADATSKKLAQPFISVDLSADLKEFATAVRGVRKRVDEYNEAHGNVVMLAELFQKALNDPLVANELTKLTESLHALEKRRMRNTHADRIDQLLELGSEVTNKEKEIESKTAKLSEESKSFCDKYFGDVQRLFSSMDTSNSFQILPRIDKRGYRPLYGFELFFEGTKIPDASISSFLSDGDRRSLALAIFFATLEDKPTLSNTVLILDDPITSLDDDRSGAVLAHLQQLLNRGVKQIILLSHNRSFIPELLSRFKGSDITCIQIVKEQDSKGFKDVSSVKLEFDPYAKRLDEVLRFVGGEAVDSEKIRMSIRLILQEEIESRYRLHLANMKFDGPGGMINHLESNGHLEPAVASKLNAINSEVRDDMHHIIDREPEATRLVGRNLLSIFFPNHDRIASTS